jgi:hypothetical protein
MWGVLGLVRVWQHWIDSSPLVAKAFGTAAVSSLLGFSALSSAYPHRSVGTNGSQLADVGGKHVEFVGGASDQAVMFGVTDEKERSFPLRGATAYVVIVSGGRAGPDSALL